MLQIQSNEIIPRDFRDGFEQGLTKIGYSFVNEEDQIQTLKEQTEQRKKECYDENCLVDVGKMLAAKGIIIVEVTKKETNVYSFKSKYIDFETGITRNSYVVLYKHSINDYEKLIGFAKEMVLNMFEKTNESKTQDFELNKNPVITKEVNTENKNEKIEQKKDIGILNYFTVETDLSYRYLTFDAVEINHLFTVKAYLTLISYKLYDFTFDLGGAGYGVGNDNYEEFSFHLLGAKYTIANFEISGSIYLFLGKYFNMQDSNDIITNIAGLKIAYSNSTKYFKIKPYISVNYAFKEEDVTYDSKNPEYNFLIGYGISFSFEL